MEVWENEKPSMGKQPTGVSISTVFYFTQTSVSVSTTPKKDGLHVFHFI